MSDPEPTDPSPPPPGPPPLVEYHSGRDEKMSKGAYAAVAVGGFFAVFVAGAAGLALCIRTDSAVPAILLGILLLVATVVISFVYKVRGWLTGVILAFVVVALLLAACGIIIVSNMKFH